ncbi:MAG TPA: hypothetical protein QF353_05315 [Gammaproteobacteria bacterium]|nr:hypothetical protein [Gammaproteobacteria bacterium]
MGQGERKQHPIKGGLGKDYNSQKIVERIQEFHAQNKGKTIYLEGVGNALEVCNKLLQEEEPMGPIQFSTDTILSPGTIEKIIQINTRWEEHQNSSKIASRQNSLNMATAVTDIGDSKGYSEIQENMAQYIECLKAGNLDEANTCKNTLIDMINNLPEPEYIEHNPLKSVVDSAQESAGIKDKISLNEFYEYAHNHVQEFGPDISKIYESFASQTSEITPDEIKANWDKNLLWELLKSSSVFIIETLFNIVDCLVKRTDPIIKEDEGLRDFIKRTGLKLFLKFMKDVGKDVLLLTLMDAYFIVVTGLIAVIAPVVTMIASSYAVHQGLDIKETVKSALSTTRDFAEFLLSQIGSSALTAISKDGKEKHLTSKDIKLAKDIYNHRLMTWKRVAKNIFRACYNFITSPVDGIKSMVKVTQDRFNLYKKSKEQYYEDTPLLNHILISQAMYNEDPDVKPPSELEKRGWKNFGETYRPKDEKGNSYTVAQAMINEHQKRIVVAYKGTDFSNKNDLLNDLFLGKRFFADGLSNKLVKYLGNRDDIEKHSKKIKEKIITLIDKDHKPKGIKLALSYSQQALKDISGELRGKGENIEDYQVIFTGHSLGGGIAQTSFVEAFKNPSDWGGVKKDNMTCEVFDAPNLSQDTHHDLSVGDYVNNYILSRTLVSQANIENPIGTILQLNKSNQSLKFQMYDVFIDKMIDRLAEKLSDEGKEESKQKLREILSLPYHKSDFIGSLIASNLEEGREVAHKVSYGKN